MFNAISPRLLIAALLIGSALCAQAADSAKPNQAALIATIQANASQKEKADACLELARVGTIDAVPALSALLADEKMSHMARYALESIPGPEVDKAFRDALGTLEGRPLVGVIGSVGVRKDAKAVKQLTGLLKNSDSDVVQAAARSLGSIGNAASVKALEAVLPSVSGAQQLAVCEGLVRCADAFASEGHLSQAKNICDTLRKVDAGHQVRAAALRGAILTRGKSGIPLLIQALQGDDYAQAAVAARTAQQLKIPEVTTALTKELNKLPPDKQVLVIQTLGQRGDAKALPALIAAARNCPMPVKLEAVRACERLGDESALPLFRELMNDTDPAVAKAAQEGLASLPGSAADKVIMELLNSTDPASQRLGMDLAARRRMTAAVPVLFRLASHPNAEIRGAAIRRIGDLASTGDMPPLLDLMLKTSTPEDIEPLEHAISTLCLKAPKREPCVERLAGRMGSAEPAQKAALIRILASLGGSKALEPVRTALKDQSPEVRSAALRALGNWSTADAATDLLQVARSSQNQTEKMVALRGYLGLAKLSDVSESQRLRMCADVRPLVQKPEEQRLLLAALGDLASGDAVNMIQPYLSEPAVKEEAANAILRVADRLLKRTEAAKDAPQLIRPLQQVADSTTNAELADRAKKLLEQARSKASQK